MTELELKTTELRESTIDFVDAIRRGVKPFDVYSTGTWAAELKDNLNCIVEILRQEEKERQAGLSRLAADVKDPSRLTFTEIEEVRK